MIKTPVFEKSNQWSASHPDKTWASTQLPGFCPDVTQATQPCVFLNDLVFQQATLQTDITGLNKLLHDKNFAWIRMRAQSTWTTWVEAAENLETKENLQNRKRQRVSTFQLHYHGLGFPVVYLFAFSFQIVIFLGSVTYNPYLFNQAFRGGPLGELVQWSDVICTLYILGHNLAIFSRLKDIVEGR